MNNQAVIHLQISAVGVSRTACSRLGNEYKVMGVVQSHPPGDGLTGDPRAVSCPACKQSEAFKKISGQFPA